MSKTVIHSIPEVSKILEMPYPPKLTIHNLIYLIKENQHPDYTSDDITKIIGEIRETLRDIKGGDMVDIQGYRGEGLYYYDGNNLLKTYGEYGYIIPSEAWKFVDKYGLRYYDNYGPEYITIPQKCTIISTSFNLGIINKKIGNNGNYICTINTLDYPNDTITINGKTYQSSLFDMS